MRNLLRWLRPATCRARSKHDQRCDLRPGHRGWHCHHLGAGEFDVWPEGTK